MDSARNPAAVKFIAEGPHLDIWCYGFIDDRRCDRRVKLTAVEIEKAFGPVDQVDIRRLNRRLTCKSCGAKARDKRVEARYTAPTTASRSSSPIMMGEEKRLS